MLYLLCFFALPLKTYTIKSSQKNMKNFNDLNLCKIRIENFQSSEVANWNMQSKEN